MYVYMYTYMHILSLYIYIYIYTYVSDVSDVSGFDKLPVLRGASQGPARMVRRAKSPPRGWEDSETKSAYDYGVTYGYPMDTLWMFYR